MFGEIETIFAKPLFKNIHLIYSKYSITLDPGLPCAMGHETASSVWLPSVERATHIHPPTFRPGQSSLFSEFFKLGLREKNTFLSGYDIVRM